MPQEVAVIKGRRSPTCRHCMGSISSWCMGEACRCCAKAAETAAPSAEPGVRFRRWPKIE